MNRKERRAAGKLGGHRAVASGARNAKADSAVALAMQHHQAGRLAEAEAMFNLAIALDPRSVEAHHGLGRLLLERDELDQAMVQLRQALALRPGDTLTGMTMVTLLKHQGKQAQAAIVYERALASDPRIGELRQQLPDELSTPWARPVVLARAGVAFIRLNPAIAACVERATKAWPKPLSAAELFGHAGIGPIARDRVLRVLLENSPICDIELERFLTRLRAVILAKAAQSDPFDDDVFALSCALAGQCFFNDYVFFADDDELRAADRLRHRLIEAIAADQAFPLAWLSAVASYHPLHTLPGADKLPGRTWPEAVATLIATQVAEPNEERICRAAMPVLTPIEDATSLRVRSQYEESPFPRWIKPSPPQPKTTLDAFVRQQFPRAPYLELGHEREIDILIAGCGTGQQSIETACLFGSERMLAVDLSLASLAYAQRQSRACGLEAIQYAQADIMNLPSTGRSFDFIGCSGVLHHLGDPLEGWRRLLTMLRPQGLMSLGFYSELARQDIVAARRHIAERGYGDSVDAIRLCRQELMGCDDAALKSVTAYPSFFSTSECRDLLFHVMEHRLTLPMIKSFLADNGLVFLGFVIDELTLLRFHHRFPDDAAMTDLDNWHRFEERHPATFSGMYQFWVQKRA